VTKSVRAVFRVARALASGCPKSWLPARMGDGDNICVARCGLWYTCLYGKAPHNCEIGVIIVHRIEVGILAVNHIEYPPDSASIELQPVRCGSGTRQRVIVFGLGFGVR